MRLRSSSLLGPGSVLGCVVALVAGCASAPPRVGPEWISDCHAFQAADAAPSLCGVGAAGYSRDPRLLERSAGQRALGEIGSTLRTAMQPVLTRAGGTVARHADQHVDALIEQSLDSAKIVARWEPADRTTAYALAWLELDAVSTVLSKATELPRNLRDDLLTAVKASVPSRQS